MFRSNKATITQLEEELKSCRENSDYVIRQKNREAEDHQIAMDRATTAHKDELARVKANIDTKIAEGLALLKADVTRLTIENEGNKQKVAMYEKAFQNLGFDVKDMKDILNKLVDGIVSKNEIKMIGTVTK